MNSVAGNALIITTLIILNTILQSDYVIQKMNDNVWSFMRLDEDRPFDKFMITLVHLVVFISLAATGGMGIISLTQDVTKKIANTAASLKK